MRIHEIRVQKTPESDWEHDTWVEKNLPQTLKILDRRMTEVRAYRWQIIPYLRKDEDIKYIFGRL